MRFSVIIPLYNKESYVERALLSVLAQTYDDYEIIVVDDGSTDGSTDIVRQLIGNNFHLIQLQKKSRLSFVRQQNSGAGVARNNGAKISKGDYLCFLDADDWWSDGFLAGINGIINDFPEAGAYGTAYYYYKNAYARTLDYALPEGFKAGYINYCRCYADSMQMPLWTGAVAIPRLVFDEVGGFSENLSLGEDFYLWIHIALKYKVAFLNTSLSYYNNDVPVTKRAVGKLHAPSMHMLWGMRDLEPIEKSNGDYKRLIDKLRVAGLYSYYLDDRYRKDAISELKKVDWTRQTLFVRIKYKLPICFLRLSQNFMIFGSKVKQHFIKTMKNV